MKNKGLAIGLIAFLTLLIVSLVFLMIKLMNGSFMFRFGHSVSKNKILEETYEIMDIDIDSKMADVHIIENVDNNIKVIVYSEQKKTTINVENNKLVIKSDSKRCRGLCFNTKIDKIVVYIPSNYINNIKIKVDSGDIKVGKFTNLVLDVETDAGDIDIDTIKKAKIKTDAGDIDINEIGSLSVDCDAGDIKISSINEYLNIKTDAGDIKVDELNITKNSRIEADAGDIKIKSTNDIYIDAKTDAGDVKISKNNRKSDIELNIRTDAGDIKVN